MRKHQAIYEPLGPSWAAVGTAHAIWCSLPSYMVSSRTFDDNRSQQTDNNRQCCVVENNQNNVVVFVFGLSRPIGKMETNNGCFRRTNQKAAHRYIHKHTHTHTLAHKHQSPCKMVEISDFFSGIDRQALAECAFRTIFAHNTLFPITRQRS